MSPGLGILYLYLQARFPGLVFSQLQKPRPTSYSTKKKTKGRKEVKGRKESREIEEERKRG
jgi:hypothetical protein